MRRHAELPFGAGQAKLPDRAAIDDPRFKCEAVQALANRRQLFCGELTMLADILLKRPSRPDSSGNEDPGEAMVERFARNNS